MLYLTITFKNNMQVTYTAEQLRITQGFVKIETSTYGNRAIPRDEIKSMRIIMVEEQQ